MLLLWFRFDISFRSEFTRTVFVLTLLFEVVLLIFDCNNMSRFGPTLPDSDSEDELPPGWEERTSDEGQVFYVK